MTVTVGEILHMLGVACDLAFYMVVLLLTTAAGMAIQRWARRAKK